MRRGESSVLQGFLRSTGTTDVNTQFSASWTWNNGWSNKRSPEWEGNRQEPPPSLRFPHWLKSVGWASQALLRGQPLVRDQALEPPPLPPNFLSTRRARGIHSHTSVGASMRLDLPVASNKGSSRLLHCTYRKRVV
jgi:hypothetical protein